MIWLSTPHFEKGTLTEFSRNLEDHFSRGTQVELKIFEKALSSYLHKPVVALNAGTSAIHLALKLAGVEPGDEVVCPDFTFAASAFPIQYLSAKPLILDIENERWGLDPNLLEEVLKQRASVGKAVKAVVSVHCYGMPDRHDELSTICERYGAELVEDAAEALGSMYKGRACGSLGKRAALSFNLNKIITSTGGGALVLDTKEEEEYARKLANQAKEDGAVYIHRETGFNYRMAEPIAAVANAQLLVLEKRVAQRRKVNETYRNILADLELEFLSDSQDGVSNHWLTCVLLKGREKPEKAVNYFKQNGIEVRPLWKPLHLQGAFKDCEAVLSGKSRALFERGLCLPSSSSLKEEEIIKVCSVLREIC